MVTLLLVVVVVLLLSGGGGWYGYGRWGAPAGSGIVAGVLLIALLAWLLGLLPLR